MRIAKCETCRWWDSEHDSVRFIALLQGQTKLGLCRKPRPGAINVGGHLYGAWAAVDVDDGCGEHKPVDGGQ